jgi:uncharacterized membrane protein
VLAETLRVVHRCLVHRLGENHHEPGKVLHASWRHPSGGEHRAPVTLTVAVAIALQVGLPDKLNFKPTYLLPALGGLILVGMVIANPLHINRISRPIRVASLLLIASLSLANAWSAWRLVVGLARGTLGNQPESLLLTGASIWATNVIVFALWYWEFDRGGPGARAVAPHPYPDLLFPQMSSPEVADPNWHPKFFDYLYTSFTNATAFSPTDVMPLSRWAKLLMMVQSAVSLITVALVIARAVNIFH